MASTSAADDTTDTQYASATLPREQHDFFNVFLGGMLGGSIVWGLRAIINEPSAWGLLCWLAHAVASYCCSCCGVAGLRKRWQPLRIVFGPRPVSLTTAHLLDHHSTTNPCRPVLHHPGPGGARLL